VSLERFLSKLSSLGVPTGLLAGLALRPLPTTASLGTGLGSRNSTDGILLCCVSGSSEITGEEILSTCGLAR